MSAVDRRHDHGREQLDLQLVVNTCVGLFLFLFFVMLGLFCLAYLFLRLLAL